LQLRGHALPHPAAHDDYRRAVCVAAPSEIREPNAGVGLDYIIFIFRGLRDELAEIVRQSTGRSDPLDHGGHSSLPLGLLEGTTSRRRLVRCAAIAVAHRRGKASLAGASTPPASFFPARAVSSAFLLPVQGARELGFHRGCCDSPPLSAPSPGC
jgi:hypothetical protein